MKVLLMSLILSLIQPLGNFFSTQEMENIPLKTSTNSISLDENETQEFEYNLSDIYSLNELKEMFPNEDNFEMFSTYNINITLIGSPGALATVAPFTGSVNVGSNGYIYYRQSLSSPSYTIFITNQSKNGASVNYIVSFSSCSGYFCQTCQTKSGNIAPGGSAKVSVSCLTSTGGGSSS